MAICKYCALEAAEELCDTCRSRLALTPGGAVRPPLPCQRCNHPALIRALARELATSAGETGSREIHPMTVTLEPVQHIGWVTGKPKGVLPGHFGRLLGVLEMYVCRKCGFTEWYCRDPENVPVGDEYGTEIVTIEGETPYR